MIDIPDRTNVYKIMPKELFYKYLNDASTLKKTFIDEIRSITWINTLTLETMAIPAGNIVSAIAVVEIVLNRQAISPSFIEIISREIDDDALFIIRYEEWGQIWCRDQGSIGKQTVLVNDRSFCQTNWVNYEELSLSIKGENLDQVYENFYFQVTGKKLSLRTFTLEQKIQESSKTFTTENEKNLNNVEAIIRNLEIQINKEKQFGKQVRLVTELKNARNELARIRRLSEHNSEQYSSERSQSVQETYESIRSFFPNVLMMF